MKTILAALILCLLALSPAHAGQKGIGTSCNSDNSTVDFDTLAQCNGSTIIKAPLMLGAVASPPYSTTACDAAKAGMLQYTGGVVQYCNGSAWSTMGSSSGTGGQSMAAGFPDAIRCVAVSSSGTTYYPVYYLGSFAGTVYYLDFSSGVVSQLYFYSNGAYYGGTLGNWTSNDCISNSWPIATLTSNGRTFNFVNGGANGAAAMADGTAGAPGLYFSADTNTGLYRPTTDNLAIATGGVERLRVTATGSVGIGTTSPKSALSVTGDLNTTDSIGINRNPVDGSLPSSGHASWGRYQLTPSQDYLSISSFNSTGTYAGQITLSATNGNVGIGTASPGDKLEVAGNARIFGALGLFGGTTGELELFHIFSGSNAAALNAYLAASVYDSGTYAGSYARLGAWDTRGGSLPLILQRDGGNVGIGTTAPLYKLHVISSDSAYATVLATNTVSGCYGYIGYNGYSAGGNCTTSFASDARLKTNIEPVQSGLDIVMKLRPVSYFWKMDGKNHALTTDKKKKAHNYGFIAQDVMKVLPDLVTETPPEPTQPPKPGEAQKTNEKTEVMYGLDYNGFISPAIKAIQELKAENDALRARLDALEARGR